MKKKILICLLIILIATCFVKTRELIILNKIHNKMNEFNSQTNRFYCVFTNFNNDTKVERKIYLKENIEKYVLIDNTVVEYSSIKNLKTNEIYNYNENQKIMYVEKNDLNYSEDYLMGMLNIISQLYFEGQLNFSQLFKVHYIIPITYEGKSCYKISTNSEIVIIDKSTYLPMYSSIKSVNSKNGDNNIEYTYKFEVGTVTDEDVAIPDFSDYKIE